MSRRRGAATAAACALSAVCGLATPARAQHVEARASLTLTGAYTRSWSDAPFPTVQTFAGPSIALSPVLVGLLDTPRTENLLGYALSLSLPIVRGPVVDQSSLTYANRLTYTGHYALDELTSATLGGAFTQSPLDTFVASQDPTAAPIQTVPGGAASMMAVNANEGLSRVVSERTNLTQAAAFAYGQPLVTGTTAQRTVTGSNVFGWTRTFLYDNLGMTLTNQYDHFTAGAGAPPTTAWVNTLALDWTHAFSESLTASFTPGATATLTPGSARLLLVEPSGTAALRYDHHLAAASLTFSHQAEPNLATATIAFDDTLALRFLIPIGTTGLIASGTAGLTHMTPIESAPSAAKLVPANVFLGDGALDYYPTSARRFSVGFRTQVARQAFVGESANSFTRFTLALHLTVAYPTAEPNLVRPELASIYAVHAPAQTDIVSSDRIRSAAEAAADAAP